MEAKWRAKALQLAGEVVAKSLREGSNVGLGSGRTIADLLRVVSKNLHESRTTVTWVPTSLQISMLAASLGEKVSDLRTHALDVAIDGADQVSEELHLIKGRGGALLKEKIVIRAAKKTIIVIDEDKLVPNLGERGVRVPVETLPFARIPVESGLSSLEGSPRLRVDRSGYPVYTESGNLVFDTLFGPIKAPEPLDKKITGLAGVMASGLFAPRPIEVLVLRELGTCRTIERSR